MGHKIVEAIIENGQIKHVDRKLPRGKIKVHLIYDTVEGIPEQTERMGVVSQTSGIYKDINGEAEARKLRAGWERNIHD